MSNQNLDIVFWGEDSFSNIVLQSLINTGHHIKLVITPFYNNLIYKRLEYTCEKNCINFIRCKDVNSDAVFDKLREISPDICVISHFEKLIKKKNLTIPRLGFINLHPSLLPNYRGMSPQHWPIINGDIETGITVHFVDETADTGDIIVQENIPITTDMYVSDLQKKWIEIYKYIVVEAIKRIQINSPLTSQRNYIGSYYGKLKVEQCTINIDGSISSAYNLIKGVSFPYYGARCYGIIIWKAHFADFKLSIEIMNKYNTNGVFLDSQFGDLLRLKDGVLIIDKYLDYERRNN